MYTITNIKNNSKTLEFDINDIDVGLLNAVRRVIISDIPNVAVYFDSYDINNNDIKFIKNTSVLHNEFTGHRISLIPLFFDKDEINDFDPEKYKFVIEEKGPKVVTTQDIRIFDNNDQEYSKDFQKKIFPVDDITGDHIIITKLKTEEEVIHLEFRGRIGTAKQHSRWCPISTCTYFNNVDETLVSKEMKKLETNDNQFNTLDKYRLFQKNEYGEPNSFHMIIESECRLTPSYIFIQAREILLNKIDNFLENHVLDVIDQESHLYAITILGENHTLGNMLQVLIFNLYVRNKNIVDFIGYVQPHPLEEKIIFKIRFYKEMDNNSIQEFMEEATERVKDEIKKIPIDVFDQSKKKTRKTK